MTIYALGSCGHGEHAPRYYMCLVATVICVLIGCHQNNHTNSSRIANDSSLREARDVECIKRILGAHIEPEDLHVLIGLKIEDAVRELRLEKATSAYYEQEPPGRLQGRSFYFEKKGWIVIYIDRRHPMYRKQKTDSGWEYEKVQDAVIGGIRCESAGTTVDYGEVPARWTMRKEQ